MMTVRQAIDMGAKLLKEKGVPDPVIDATLLVGHVMGLSRLETAMHGTAPLTTLQEQHITTLLSSRSDRIPLQYLLGIAWFYGRPFQVDHRVLIPRPETETLCEIALTWLQAIPHPRVLDLCTGSGAIAITLACECSKVEVIACDISAEALTLATNNAKRNEANVKFLQGDLFSPLFHEQFHCILSNPPYIESNALSSLQEEVQKEPRLALDGGKDGLAFYKRICLQAHQHLLPGGYLGLEIGANQGALVQALLLANGNYQNIKILHDLTGLPRIVFAQVTHSPT